MPGRAKFNATSLLFAIGMAFAPWTLAQDTIGEPGRDDRGKNPLRNVYFGEQHMHTQASPDSFSVGNRGTWADAYNWALGKEITLTASGEKIRKSTPYDFVGITDHAEYFGIMPRLMDPKDPLYGSDLGKAVRDPNTDQTAPDSPINKFFGSILTSTPVPELNNPELIFSSWAQYVKAAKKFNKPGKFTTLVAFEWTSIPTGQNMHRNVFFRGDGPPAPFSAFNSIYPKDLWTYQEINRGLGYENLAIPHNGNISNGWMYSRNQFLGGPMTERQAKRRARNEPLTEMIQTKGQSETHPLLSPNDEFADFELFQNLLNVGQPSQIKNGYIREALARGMVIEEDLRTNPFKYGFAGGSDSHSAYSPNEEWNFHGSHAKLDATAEARLNPTPNASGDVAGVVGSAGVTAVWAEENTRGSIFDAMARKETYATSGPLIRLRFFGSWDYDEDLDSQQDFVAKAYEDGVPMGGDLPLRGDAKSPTFAVWALKDPESGNLDRIQIIKAFVNKWGRPDEAIYDVALSDGRVVDSDTGKAPPVGNTVDIATATYTNDIGESQLGAVWSDPNFDPLQRAAYYVRVIEIPTPRWSTYDAARNNLEIPESLPPTIQERAWSSPIWYTPTRDELIERRLQQVTGEQWGVTSLQLEPVPVPEAQDE
jgi:hypothetical protein